MNTGQEPDAPRADIRIIPLAEIDDFPEHPFQVRMDAEMEQLAESVREFGVITPVTLRVKEDGRYEIVSGHRRKKACELAGLETVPADVRNLTRDEAVILMVDSNLQRATVLPSEKAFSYRMKLEAINRQGQRTDLTFSPVDKKLYSGQQLASNTGDSQAQIYRYIRLTNLIPDLLRLVDDGKIALRPAVELSYLRTEEQEALSEAIGYADATPSHAQAIKFRRFSGEGRLTKDVIESVMCEEKPNQKEKISIQAEQLRKWIPASVSRKETERYILKALEYYYRYRQREFGHSR